MFAALLIADFSLQAVLRTEPDAVTAPPGVARCFSPRSDNPQSPQRGLKLRAATEISPTAVAAVPSASPAGRAAALFSDNRKRSLVLTANAAARAAGVEAGMTAPQAVARCPSLLIRTPNPAAEADARAALLAVALTLAPIVEDTAPGICTIDLRGTDPARHHAAAESALAQLAALALPATAGLARTPLLALYAARRLTPHAPVVPPPGDDPLLCESPAGALWPPSTPPASPVLCLAPADEPSFLAPLPLATAEPSVELAAILASWGLRTLGDLTALPRDELVRRFGAAGLALWRRAYGGEPRPLHPIVPPREFAAAMDFEEPVEALDPLLFILRRFLDRLALELHGAHAVAAELALTLQHENGPPYARRFRLPEPTADPGILFRTLHTHLESLQTDSAIAGLHLQISPARPLVRQPGLFDTGLRDPHGFAETLARVSSLLGAERVGTPHPEDTHRPDALKLTPPPAVVPPPAAPPVHLPTGLPLRRFRPPLPANLEFTPTERQPTYVWTERFHGAITHVRGPWCSSGDWWQADRAWSRTEWDIALATGGLYRLLRLGEAYFIEGEYD